MRLGRKFGSKQPSRKSRLASLTLRLIGCRPEMLPALTAEQLHRESGVPVSKCAELLMQAREMRG